MLRTNGRPTLARSRPDLAHPMRQKRMLAISDSGVRGNSGGGLPLLSRG